MAVPRATLYVQIDVQAHPIFQRDGRHLHCEVPISFADAALGGELEVPTLDGRVKLKVPAGDSNRQGVSVRAAKASRRFGEAV